MGNRRWINWLPSQLSSKLSGRINLQAVIANSAWLIGEKVIRMALGLIVGAWVARYLGPSQYGEIAYALAYIAFFQAITSLGIDGIVVREMSCDKTHAAQILSTGFILRLGTGLLSWLTAAAVMIWMHGWSDRTTWIVVIVGSGLIFQAADTIDLWFQSQSQSRRTTIAKLCAYAIANAVKIILLLNHASIISFALVMALEILLNAIGLIYVYFKYTSKSKLEIIWPLGLRLLTESWPFMLSSLSIMAYMRIDQIMIKEILSERELGIYAAVLPLSTTWQIIPVTLAASLGPFLAAKKSQNETNYLQMLDSIFRTFALIGWAICIPICIFSYALVSLLLGDQYQQGGKILSIHIFTNLFIGLGIAQGMWAINERKSKIFLYKVFLGAVICFVGNILLLPSIGIIGSAYVAVISQMFAAVLSNIFFAPSIFKMQIRSIFFLKRII